MLKTLHLILALNVLLSSTGLTVFEHLCQMKGRTVSVFIQPKSCCKAKALDKLSCCSPEKEQQDASMSRNPCCKDKSQFFKSNIDGGVQKIALPNFKFQASSTQVLPFQPMATAIVPSSQKALRFYLYKPPPKVTDIRVFIQSFLC